MWADVGNTLVRKVVWQGTQTPRTWRDEPGRNWKAVEMALALAPL